MKSFRPKDGSGESPAPGRNGERNLHKEKRSNETHERPVPEDLTDSIERYLEIYMPILAGGKPETNSLWFVINSNQMSYASMASTSPRPQG